MFDTSAGSSRGTAHHERTFKPTISSRFARGALLCGLIAFLATVSVSDLSASEPLDGTGHLLNYRSITGIDTILVAGGSAPGNDLLPIPPRYAGQQLKHVPPNPFLIGLKDVFSDAPWITIELARDAPKEIAKPNVLVIDFAVTARRQNRGKSDLTLGALGIQLLKYEADGSRTALSLHPITYPFIVPDNEKELNIALKDGVHFLTGYLPCYFAEANHKSCSAAKGPFFTYPYSTSETHSSPPPSEHPELPQPLPLGPQITY